MNEISLTGKTGNSLYIVGNHNQNIWHHTALGEYKLNRRCHRKIGLKLQFQSCFLKIRLIKKKQYWRIIMLPPKLITSFLRIICRLLVNECQFYSSYFPYASTFVLQSIILKESTILLINTLEMCVFIKSIFPQKTAKTIYNQIHVRLCFSGTYLVAVWTRPGTLVLWSSMPLMTRLGYVWLRVNITIINCNGISNRRRLIWKINSFYIRRIVIKCLFHILPQIYYE